MLTRMDLDLKPSVNSLISTHASSSTSVAHASRVAPARPLAPPEADRGANRHWDGYFESALIASGAVSPGYTNIVDQGQAFDGLKDPPFYTGGYPITSRLEPDANYAVLVTTNWNTTTWITSKATTGFTINFGTAAPSNAVVDYMIVR